MKSLAATITLVLAFAIPTLAGYHPTKSGGPRTSRGAGTRIFAPQQPICTATFATICYSLPQI